MWSGGPGLCLTCQTFQALMLIQALGSLAFLLMFSRCYEGHLQLGSDHVVPCTDVFSYFCCHGNHLKQWWSDRLCDTKLRDWTCSGLHTGLDLKVCRCQSPSHCPQTTPPVQHVPQIQTYWADLRPNRPPVVASGRPSHSGVSWQTFLMNIA